MVRNWPCFKTLHFLKPHRRSLLVVSIMLLAAISLTALADMPAAAPAGEEQAAAGRKFRLDGEYGLWVWERDGQLTVQWISAEKDSGLIEVLQDGRLVHRQQTAFGLSHRSSFPRPAASQLLLRYGGASAADRHETTVYFDLPTGASPAVFSDADSVFVLGDTHGQYRVVVEQLTKHGVIDAAQRWRGGAARLVVLGDMFDRGHDVIKLLWFLYRLERDARSQGGAVHVVLGNHEVMVFLDDLRYTSGKEKLIAQYHGVSYADMFNIQESILGQWLASKPGMLKINSVLLAHGGITDRLRGFTVDTFNDSLYTFLHEREFYTLANDTATTIRGRRSLYARRAYFFFGEESAFWYRDYVQSDTTFKMLDRVLDRFDARVHVIAHTTVRNVKEFYFGKLIAVDLDKPATQMLLLKRPEPGKGDYRRYRCYLDGRRELLF